MSSATKIADEDDGDDISNFIGASNDAWKAGRDFEPFLYGRDHRIYVTWTKCLLQRDEKRQKEHKHLEKSRDDRSLMCVNWTLSVSDDDCECKFDVFLCWVSCSKKSRGNSYFYDIATSCTMF